MTPKSHFGPTRVKRRSPAAASLAERQFAPKVVPGKTKGLHRNRKHKGQSPERFDVV